MESFVRMLIYTPREEAAVARFCIKNGWDLVRRIAPVPEKLIPLELVFLTDRQGTSLHYIDEPIVGFPYLQANGPECQEVAARVRAEMPIFTDHELFTRWDEAESPEEAERAILMLGVASPEKPVPEFLERILQGLSHPQPGVRLAAILAVGYRGWPAFEAPLHERQSDDPDEHVRTRSGNMLQAMREERTA